MKFINYWVTCGVVLCTGLSSSAFSWAVGSFVPEQEENYSSGEVQGTANPSAPVKIVLLHTNDLHSRFKPDKSPLALGGYARLKTAIDREKVLNPDALLLDGGDWSEGDMYYTFGAGVESLRMLDRLGVDIAAVGNHDWFNGPDTLLGIMKQVQPRTQLLAANLGLRDYDRAQEIREKIPPYVIREVRGVKVAIIGLCTYEWVYDRLLEPVTVKSPLGVAHQFSKMLKSQGLADVVIAISHNSVLMNQAILSYAPDLDVIVGAHDHQKLTEAKEVGLGLWRHTPGWIVEAGYGGKFLGHLDLTYSVTEGVHVQSKLIQIDGTIPEDPQMKAQIEAYDLQLKAEEPAVEDFVAISQTTLLHTGGAQNSIGELITDAYRWATGSPMALESYKFVYGEIFPGKLSTFDIYNINPAVYNPKTKKTWTIKKIALKGWVLKRILDLGYGTQQVSQYGLISVSGMSLVYDPWFAAITESFYDLSRFFGALKSLIYDSSVSGVQDIQMASEPLNDYKTYHMAVGGGIIEGIRFTNRYLGSVMTLPLEAEEDTGLEPWRVLKDYLAHLGVLPPSTQLARIRPFKGDYSIGQEMVTGRLLKRFGGPYAPALVEVTARVRNVGMSDVDSNGPMGPVQARLLVNKNLPDLSVAPQYKQVGAVRKIPSLAAGAEAELKWKVILRSVAGRYPLTVQLVGTELEINTQNNEVDQWFDL